MLGSAAVSRARTLVAAGAIGKVRGVGVFGAWLRDEEYWQRAPWAGRRRLDGRPVMDGALTNPFAHGLAAALRLAGATRMGQVAAVQTELFRANDIDTDDTSCVRVTCHGGPTVLAAVSLCADRDHEPTVSVFGSRGSLRLAYNEDRLLIRTPTQSAERTLPRVDLLDNLVAHRRDPSVPLVADLEHVGGFMQVLEAIRVAPEPVRIVAPHAEVVGIRRRPPPRRPGSLGAGGEGEPLPPDLQRDRRAVGGGAAMTARPADGAGRVVTVAAAQMGPVQPDDTREHTLGRMTALLEEAAQLGAELVAYPEAALTPFFPHWSIDDPAELDALLRAGDAQPPRRPVPGPRRGTRGQG